jgi:hypothetical protein
MANSCAAGVLAASCRKTHIHLVFQYDAAFAVLPFSDSAPELPAIQYAAETGFLDTHPRQVIGDLLSGRFKK